MNKVTTAFVTELSGKESSHYVLADGVTILPNGTLMLTYERDINGNISDGHIYAPGQWKEISIQTENQ